MHWICPLQLGCPLFLWLQFHVLWRPSLAAFNFNSSVWWRSDPNTQEEPPAFVYFCDLGLGFWRYVSPPRLEELRSQIKECSREVLCVWVSRHGASDEVNKTSSNLDNRYVSDQYFTDLCDYKCFLFELKSPEVYFRRKGTKTICWLCSSYLV